jgi:hypothetical protein
MSPGISSASASISACSQCAGWCSTHNLRSSPKGNNYRYLCPIDMVARTTYNQNTPEIGSTGHGYQTHYAGHPRQHLLYMGMCHPAGKML